MSSRILRAEAAQAARPFEWAKTGRRPGGWPGHRVSELDGDEVGERPARLEWEARQREAAAWQAGFREGGAEAEGRLAALLKEAVARLGSRVEELAGLRRKLRQEAEEDLVRLAVAIARRVLWRELSVDPGAIRGIVKAALEGIDIQEIVRIRVHPEVASLLEEWLRGRGAAERVEVVPDGSLDRGGVVVETERGSLDASVETQLEEIERGLVDRVSRIR